MSCCREITRCEVSMHSEPEDCWMIIRNDVIDATEFLEQHPGGLEILIEYAGCDATDAFESVGHSMTARLLVEKYRIGVLPADEQSCLFSEYISQTKKLLASVLHISA